MLQVDRLVLLSSISKLISGFRFHGALVTAGHPASATHAVRAYQMLKISTKDATQGLLAKHRRPCLISRQDFYLLKSPRIVHHQLLDAFSKPSEPVSRAVIDVSAMIAHDDVNPDSLLTWNAAGRCTPFWTAQTPTISGGKQAVGSFLKTSCLQADSLVYSGKHCFGKLAKKACIQL